MSMLEEPPRPGPAQTNEPRPPPFLPATPASWTCSMLLDPILRPIQRIMPDTRPLDLSPMVLIFGLTILERILVQVASQGM